jgi:rubrerythrin
VAAATLEELRREIEVMIDIEKSLSSFYEKCAELFPQDAEFWSDLSKDEQHHANVLKTLAKATLKRARHFEVGKSFGSGSLVTFLNQVRANLARLDCDPLKERDALMIAYHMEGTLVEQKYAEVLKTDKPEYVNVLEKILDETRMHKKKLVARMKLHKK